jgi:hypothetical protein
MERKTVCALLQRVIKREMPEDPLRADGQPTEETTARPATKRRREQKKNAGEPEAADTEPKQGEPEAEGKAKAKGKAKGKEKPRATENAEPKKSKAKAKAVTTEKAKAKAKAKAKGNAKPSKPVDPVTDDARDADHGSEVVPSPASGRAPPEKESKVLSDESACMMSFYQLDAADRAAIIGARSSKEVPVKLRNKLYAALNRFLGKPSVVSKKVADQWAAAEAKGNHGKFEFLKQWAMDTKGGQIRLEDEYTKGTEDLDMDEYTWLTKCDLYNMKKAYKYQDMKIYCDKLMASAKTKPHKDPKFKKDKEMTLYRILTANLETHEERSKRVSRLTLDAAADKEAIPALMKNFLTSKALDEEDNQKNPNQKSVKVGLEEQRLKVIQADLTEAAVICNDIDKSDSQYLPQIKANITLLVTKLKDASHKLHEEKLAADNDKIETAWLTVVDVIKKIRKDFDSAKSMLNPKAFTPYETKWDSCLKST